MYCLSSSSLFTDSLHNDLLRGQMAWQNLWQLIKEEYSRVLPSITTILTWVTAGFCQDGIRKRCCRALLPSVKNTYCLFALFFFLIILWRSQRIDYQQHFTSAHTIPSVWNAFSLSFLSPPFQSQPKWNFPYELFPVSHGLTPSELWQHFFSISIIIISMLQCILCNYLSVWIQLETSNTGTIASLFIFASPAPRSVTSTEQGLGSRLLNDFTTIVWIFPCWGPDLLRVQWLQ